MADLGQEWGNVFKTQDSIHLNSLDCGARHGRRLGGFGTLRDNDSAARFDPRRAARAVVIRAGEHDRDDSISVCIRG
jgi:hypothetical protein